MENILYINHDMDCQAVKGDLLLRFSGALRENLQPLKCFLYGVLPEGKVFLSPVKTGRSEVVPVSLRCRGVEGHGFL